MWSSFVEEKFCMVRQTDFLGSLRFIQSLKFFWFISRLEHNVRDTLKNHRFELVTTQANESQMKIKFLGVDERNKRCIPKVDVDLIYPYKSHQVVYKPRKQIGGNSHLCIENQPESETYL
jgi:hypothetical protein